MPRQKKIVPYVPQTVYPKQKDDQWKVMYEHRERFTMPVLYELIDQLYNNPDMVEQRDRMLGKGYLFGHDAEYRYNKVSEYYQDKWTGEDLNDGNFWDMNKRGVLNANVEHILNHIVKLTDEYRELNNRFLAEYDSRSDLQQVYRDNFLHSTQLLDIDGMYIQNWTYASTDYADHNEKVKASRTLYKDRPDSYLMFQSVYGNRYAKSFLEKNRNTPYQPGDLVRLRDPFVGHWNHDPLFADRWAVQRGEKEPTPDRETLRIGTVMKVTEDISGWKASKGSKLIEVLWIGKEDTVFVPERILRWEERPTKANGGLK